VSVTVALSDAPSNEEKWPHHDRPPRLADVDGGEFPGSAGTGTAPVLIHPPGDQLIWGIVGIEKGCEFPVASQPRSLPQVGRIHLPASFVNRLRYFQFVI